MDVYIATIQPFAFQFAPRGWMSCSGQILSIAQYSALYSLIGVTYGGDGVNTLALPNLNGRTILGQGSSTTGSSYSMGEMSGSESTTLMTPQMPQHTHGLMGTTAAATTAEPGAGLVLASASGSDPVTGDAITVHVYGPAPANTMLSPQSIGAAGGSQPFSIMQPYIVINYCIATEGIFPSRN